MTKEIRICVTLATSDDEKRIHARGYRKNMQLTAQQHASALAQPARHEAQVVQEILRGNRSGREAHARPSRSTPTPDGSMSLSDPRIGWPGTPLLGRRSPTRSALSPPKLRSIPRCPRLRW